MARLLIASRSMALALRLADAHDIVEHSPDELDRLRPGDDVDAVVLDVGEASVAVDAVIRLRGLGYETPVLLVSGYHHEWSKVAELELPGVKVVPLPITRVALLEGVGYLTGTIVDLSSIPETPVAGTDQVADAAGETTDGPRDGDADDAVGPEETDGEPSGGSAAAPEPAPEAPESPEGPAADVPAAGPPAVPIVPSPTPPPPATGQPAARPQPAATAAQPGTTEDPLPPWGRAETDGPAPYSPPWGTPVPDDEEWGPAPHLPPSTTHPMQSVPPTPLGGIRRPTEDGESGGGRSSTLDPREPPVGAPGMGRRRPLLSGRRGRSLRPTITGRGETADRRSAAPAHPEPVAHRDPAPSDELDVMALGAQPEADPFASALEQRLDANAAAGALGQAAGQPATPELVRMLLERGVDLYGVGDTAQVLADDVVERADADAAAVLVPDGGVWRVSGGVGLRPLERRLVLDASHWMIAEIANPGRAVLIEDTDIVRQQLSGAPLAAWRHLLAVPVPDVRAAVVLARGQEAGPFTDRDLTAVVPTVREAAILLAQAIETRHLARLLAPLGDPDQGPRD